jgi:hypothetical protein
MDFVHDTLADGRAFRVLTVVDQWSRQSPLLEVRDECLNVTQFASLAPAIAVIEAWRCDYNEHRPHGALGYLTPQAFGDQRQATTSRDAA